MPHRLTGHAPVIGGKTQNQLVSRSLQPSRAAAVFGARPAQARGHAVSQCRLQQRADQGHHRASIRLRPRALGHCLSASTTIGTGGVSRLPRFDFGGPILPPLSARTNMNEASIEIDTTPRKPALARIPVNIADKGPPTTDGVLDQLVEFWRNVPGWLTLDQHNDDREQRLPSPSGILDYLTVTPGQSLALISTSTSSGHLAVSEMQ